VAVVLDYGAFLLAALGDKISMPLSCNITVLVVPAEQHGLPRFCCSLRQDHEDGGRPDDLIYREGYPARFSRRSANCWDDQEFVEQMQVVGRRQVLLAGLYTETAVSLAALSGLAPGYDVFLVADATTSSSSRVHWLAVRRMVQAGVVPVTLAQVPCEFPAGKEYSLDMETIWRSA
jgi:hypothetical protein